MKTIIAGGRDCLDMQILLKAVEACPFEITEVVSGCAKGADTLGEKWGESKRLPIHKYPADWNKNGKAAGPIRNILMADNAEALLALWDGSSKGTKHMIDTATKKGLQVSIWRY